jgi:hypothetical protein
LYWLAGLPAPFVLLYVPGLVTVRGDAAATALKIRAQETLFQLNIFGHLWNLVFFIFLAMALYQLLSHVNKARAALMVILVLVSLPISFLGLLADVGILVLLRGGDYLAAFSEDQLDSLAYFLLVMRGKAIVVAQIFWGLWLLPLGLLIMRSRFIPRLLGVLLIPNAEPRTWRTYFCDAWVSRTSRSEVPGKTVSSPLRRSQRTARTRLERGLARP